jgi:hypothetical protein
LSFLHHRAGDQDIRFRDLFNGKDLDGWVVDGPTQDKEEKPIWTVTNGMIHCTGKAFGFLRYDQEQFADFHLHVEYRLAPKANSGIGIRAGKFDARKSSLTRPSYAAYEIQILDDADRPASKGSTGSLYRYAAPTANPARPAPEWNSMDIECAGHQIRVTINGRKVLDVDQRSLADVSNKPAGAPSPKEKPLKGYIALQSHSGQVEFRKGASTGPQAGRNLAISQALLTSTAFCMLPSHPWSFTSLTRKMILVVSPRK